MCQKSTQKYTVQDFFNEFPNEDKCLKHLFDLRFSGKMCPGCNKLTRFDRVRTRKSFQCSKCYHQIYPCAGTMFERSRTSMLTWYYVLYVFSMTKNGVSAMEIQRHIGTTYKTALRMLNCIRAMVATENLSFFSGSVEMDETFVGGKNINRHADKKVANSQGRACIDKTPVFGMFNRETGRVRCIVMKDTSAKSIKPIIYENVEPGANIYTDEWKAYNGLKKLYTHKRVNHQQKIFGTGDTTSNRIENAWSVFKRGIKGSYIKVSRKNLQAYVDEFVFRFNNRNSKIPIFYQALALIPLQPFQQRA